ncbi:UvrD-helicase domain-containing protein [Microtetraspora malaysiensis]|uniref:UvrD-helicase domain-containing protein n=1 Tax=Microtetraspora malaysiensis TaxID=161358 RepID=UPI003D93DEE9
MTVLFTQPGAPEGPAPFTAAVAPALDRAPTSEQQAIIDAARTGTDLVIEAGAGTGKTTTLKMVAATSGQRGLYLAYNKAIAEDARANFPPGTHCATAHSLAYRAVGHQYQNRLNGPRLPAREIARILGIPAVLDLGKHGLTSFKVAHLVMDTVSRFCHSADVQVGPEHVPAVPGLDDASNRMALRAAITPLAARAWTDITNPGGRLRFTHDHYLKIWALTRPVLSYELLMLDEAQDANPVIADVVERQQHAQRILVGDRSQAIYGWRGAIDAMSSFDGERLALTQSWRFGQQIADEANVWLDLLDAPLRLAGNPHLDSKITRLPAARAILCRTNAGAIAQAMHALRAGRSAAMVGDGVEIRALAEAARDLRAGKGTSHPELMAFKTWTEVQDYAENDSGGTDLKVLVKLIDSHGPDAIITTVDQLSSELVADVVISTAHKAKGREWPTVRLADDFPEMHDAETGELRRAEAMLAYVAVTRAQDALDRTALWGTGRDTWPQETLPISTDERDIHSPTSEPNASTPMAPDSAAVTTAGDKAAPAGSVQLPPEAANWLAAYKEAEANEAAWKAVKERAEEQLKAMLGDAEEATLGDRPAITWKWSKPGGQLDGKALKADHPGIYAEYYKAKKPGRPFNLLGEWK